MDCSVLRMQSLVSSRGAQIGQFCGSFDWSVMLEQGFFFDVECQHWSVMWVSEWVSYVGERLCDHVGSRIGQLCGYKDCIVMLVSGLDSRLGAKASHLFRGQVWSVIWVSSWSVMCVVGLVSNVGVRNGQLYVCKDWSVMWCQDWSVMRVLELVSHLGANTDQLCRSQDWSVTICGCKNKVKNLTKLKTKYWLIDICKITLTLNMPELIRCGFITSIKSRSDCTRDQLIRISRQNLIRW